MDRFYGLLLRFVVPVAFQRFMLALVSASDAVMLGRLSQNAMSASSLAGQVQYVFSIFITGLCGGVNILSAQYFGKGDKAAIEKIMGFVWKLSIPISALFTVAALMFPRTVMLLFTSSAPLIEQGAAYLKAVALSYLFCGVSQIYLAVMKNTGRAAQSAMVSSCCVVLNIVLNAILIFGLFGVPAMGVTGAAVATTVTRFVEMVWALMYTRDTSDIRIRGQYLLHTDKPLFSDYRKYTAPIMLNGIAWGFGTAMQSVILGHLGEDAAAANAIASITKSLISALAGGIAVGGGIMIGNELGAGELEQAKKDGDRLMRLAVYNGIFTGLLIVAIGPLIARTANLTPTAAYYLKIMFYMCGGFMFGRSINASANSGIFRAGGDSRFGFICDTITMWVVVVPLAALAAWVWHLPVLWVYFFVTLDETVKIPAMLIHYKKYRWVKNITK